MSEERLALQDPAGISSQLYSQKQLLDEISQIKNQWSEDKAMLAFHKNQCTIQSLTIQEMRAHIEEQRKKLDEFRCKAPLNEIELENAQKANLELRKQAVMITEKLEMIEKRWASGAQHAYMLTIKNLVKGMELKGANEFAQFSLYVGKAPKFSMQNSNRNAGVMTDVNNLENAVGLIYEKTNNFKECEVQTESIVKTKQTQTELQTMEADQ